MKIRFSAVLPGRVFLVVLFLCLATAPGWARAYHVAMFDSTVHVDDDGSARITEKITFDFRGQFQGVYRTIPVDYPGPRGTNYSLFVRVTSITDDSGTALKYEKHTSKGFLNLKIYVPGAVDAQRTVNIEYAVTNATKFFDDHDEFYWNVTGNDWLVPIDEASTIVYFPAQASGSMQAQAFRGAFHSSERAETSVEGPAVTANAAKLLPRGGLTIDVYIPSGILHQPGGLTRAGWFLQSNPVITLPVWAFVVMFALWWVKGRDPDPGMSVAPVYEPPEKMRPAELGSLLDDGVAPRDITAVLVDLAVRGYIKIVETDHKGLLTTTKDYEFQLLKNRDAWGDLNDYERAMMDRMFVGTFPVAPSPDGHPASSVRLTELRNHFYTALPVMKDEIMSALKQKGMYTVDPDSAHILAGFGAAAIVAPYLLLQFVGWADFLNSTPLLVMCGIIAAVIVFLFGRLLTATSLKGARTQVEIRGFQEFMNRVDADRLKRMPLDTFEKFLPYAMALGVEHRWAKNFEGIAQNPPTWYQGTSPGMFNSIYFVNSIGYMSQQATSTFVSAPRASSGSSGWSGGGFSGGGFSGGGFGGGGGGAF
ncbi:MAG TPA: DUF2207 domain-containing protein [Candidatus Angelobacter sp.]|nr:DUF2207 domain-containing protein [Candidatus Angelobacter sp.]